MLQGLFKEEINETRKFLQVMVCKLCLISFPWVSALSYRPQWCDIVCLCRHLPCSCTGWTIRKDKIVFEQTAAMSEGLLLPLTYIVRFSSECECCWMHI